KQLTTPNAPVKPKRKKTHRLSDLRPIPLSIPSTLATGTGNESQDVTSPTDAGGEVQPLINSPFDFSFGDELLYPSSPYPDTISDTAKSPVQAQYVYDEET
ncbi:hypothetical protein K435DRAFT_878227, partial [Dendrothele bispora CBS 962.96]